jgi:hypothetical protein
MVEVVVVVLGGVGGGVGGGGVGGGVGGEYTANYMLDDCCGKRSPGNPFNNKRYSETAAACRLATNFDGSTCLRACKQQTKERTKKQTFKPHKTQLRNGLRRLVEL